MESVQGYSINNGTYQTLILGISSMKVCFPIILFFSTILKLKNRKDDVFLQEDNLGKLRRAIMPEKLPQGEKPPKR